MKFTKQQKDRYKRIKTLSQMQKMDPVDFEHFTGWLYQKDGYRVGDTVVTGDEGIDLTLSKRGRKTIVQCKRYSGTVGQPTVRDLFGAMHHVGASEAHLVTTGRISRQAEAWAAGKPIVLIDGHDLVSWVNKNRREKSASSGSWIPWTVAAGLAGLLLVTALIVGGAYWIFQQRVSSPETPIVQVPTRADDEDAVDPSEEVTPEPGAPELVPTVTLPSGNGAGSNPDVTAVRLDSPPVIDGRLDDWRGVEPATKSSFQVYTIADWDGSADLDAEWRLGWDEANLYIIVRVSDNLHVQTQTGNLTYQGDSLEMQIDTDLRGDQTRTTLSADEFQLVFSPGDFAGLAAEAFRFRANDEGNIGDNVGHAIAVASQQTSEGYVLEAAIPWEDLDVEPEVGLALGLNLNANDNDTPNTAAQEVMLSNVSTRTFRNPTTWGSLTLSQ